MLLLTNKKVKTPPETKSKITAGIQRPLKLNSDDMNQVFDFRTGPSQPNRRSLCEADNPKGSSSNVRVSQQ